MKKKATTKYDGIVSTEFCAGSDGTCAMYLKISPNLPKRSTLTGYGHDERSSALHLITQLRHYADWIASKHGLSVLNQTELDRLVALKVGE